ncbi:MAG: hypothetical protein GYA76_01185 [Verrucomicrobia bacterium]|jgi:hypothetical protein|nr:hypothetical protein [Verrucomicrobiota bacterium]
MKIERVEEVLRGVREREDREAPSEPPFSREDIRALVRSLTDRERDVHAVPRLTQFGASLVNLLRLKIMVPLAAAAALVLLLTLSGTPTLQMTYPRGQTITRGPDTPVESDLEKLLPDSIPLRVNFKKGQASVRLADGTALSGRFDPSRSVPDTLRVVSFPAIPLQGKSKAGETIDATLNLTVRLAQSSPTDLTRLKLESVVWSRMELRLGVGLTQAVDVVREYVPPTP